MIYFNPLKKEYLLIEDQINEAIQRVCQSGYYILGPEGELFEDEFKTFLGGGYCVSVGNGTDAIRLSLMALGIGFGDEVLVSGLTAFPTISAIQSLGAVPVLVEVCDLTALMDISDLASRLTKKTRAIIPVHLYGQSCDMDSILSFAKKHHCVVVEDCAQACGAFYKSKRVGTLGNCGAFSFYPTKNLGAMGDAGAIFTTDKHIYEKIKKLRNYGQSEPFVFNEVGVNSRCDEIQSAVLRVKLNYLDLWNQKRIKQVELYRSLLMSHLPLKEEVYGQSVYHLFVIKLNERERIKRILLEKEIQTLIHYPYMIHRQKVCLDSSLSLKNVEKLCQTVLSLPLHYHLKQKDIHYICDVINKHL